MSTLKGTKTERNILTAFSGESQARNRYTFFAKKAMEDGFVQIADIFKETAEQEKAHAKVFFKLLQGGEIEISGTFPSGVIATTLENLKGSAAGENYEHSTMYPNFAKTAKEENFSKIASIFKAIAVAEKQHEKRYLKLATNIKNGTVFKQMNPSMWRCRNCGYVSQNNEAPNICPACAHSQAHFELLSENY